MNGIQNPIINDSNLTPGQKELLQTALAQFIREVSIVVPPMEAPVLSGGQLLLKTNSGLALGLQWAGIVNRKRGGN